MKERGMVGCTELDRDGEEGRGGRETEREVGPRLGQAQVQVVKRHLLSMALWPQCRQNRGPDRRGPQLFGPYKSRWQ